MFHIKKSILTTIFTFFIFSHIFALKVQDTDPEPFFGMERNSETSTSTTTETTTTNSINTFDTQPYNFSRETNTEKIVSYTITYEDRIILAQDYYNKETGDSEHGKMQLYPDISLMNEGRQSFEIPSDLNSNTQNNSNTDSINNPHPSNKQQDHDDFANKLKDDILDSRRQEIENRQTSQTSSQQNNIRIIQRQKALYELDKLRTSSTDPKEIFAPPSVQAHFKQFKYDLIEKYRDKKVFFFSRKKTFPTAESEIKFANALSIQVAEYLSKIRYANLIDAKVAFAELKELWPWERDHTFLTSSFVDGTGENGFIAHLGIDIMKIAERDLISRFDYISQHVNPESLKNIQEFREKCIIFQQIGNRSALLQEELRLRHELFENGKNDNLITNICYAIAEKIYSDSITNVLYEIVHAQSLEKAYNQLHYLEMQILDQAKQHNITLTDEIKNFIVKQYGFDLIEAAYNCYTSRPDYIKTVNDQPVLSNNNLSSILHNIEHKALPIAHAELVHLQKQIVKTFESSKIADKATRKGLMVKKFGMDILEEADNTYKNRSDHKKLVKSFIDIDVNKATATILENNNRYESVANEMSNLAERIFGNARLCNLSNLPKIESHVYDSIEAMRIAQDHPTFIFNFSMVNHTLGDIQQLAHAILSGTHPVLQRSSELLMGGLETFFKGLNPVTQASNMGHLACDLGSLLKKSGTALWNDPIAVIHNGMNTTCTLIDLIRNTADFTSDLTVGKLYLSPEEYKQRTDQFCAMIEPLQDVTAQQCFNFTFQLAADVIVWKGLGTAYTFLKEIDVLEKLGGSAAVIARTFKKGFDTHLANNPIVVTAEGITIKISEAMHNINNNGGNNIIKSTKDLFESAYAKIAIDLEEKIKKIREAYILKPNHDFPNFGNRHIKIALEHILGVELKWSELGFLLDLSGFHHDFMGAVEKSKAFKFLNKVMNENGCYSADIVLEGKTFPKTFFPQHWSQREVADKIYEAYYNFINSGAPLELGRGGKYVVKGYTSEGIKIEMHVTQKGLITTAYPTFK